MDIPQPPADIWDHVTPDLSLDEKGEQDGRCRNCPRHPSRSRLIGEVKSETEKQSDKGNGETPKLQLVFADRSIV